MDEMTLTMWTHIFLRVFLLDDENKFTNKK